MSLQGLFVQFPLLMGYKLGLTVSRRNIFLIYAMNTYSLYNPYPFPHLDPLRSEHVKSYDQQLLKSSNTVYFVVISHLDNLKTEFMLMAHDVVHRNRVTKHCHVCQMLVRELLFIFVLLLLLLLALLFYAVAFLLSFYFNMVVIITTFVINE